MPNPKPPPRSCPPLLYLFGFDVEWVAGDPVGELVMFPARPLQRKAPSSFVGKVGPPDRFPSSSVSLVLSTFLRQFTRHKSVKKAELGKRLILLRRVMSFYWHFTRQRGVFSVFFNASCVTCHTSAKLFIIWYAVVRYLLDVFDVVSDDLVGQNVVLYSTTGHLHQI